MYVHINTGHIDFDSYVHRRIRPHFTVCHDAQDGARRKPNFAKRSRDRRASETAEHD